MESWEPFLKAVGTILNVGIVGAICIIEGVVMGKVIHFLYMENKALSAKLLEITEKKADSLMDVLDDNNKALQAIAQVAKK